jgi:hypothetical protein
MPKRTPSGSSRSVPSLGDALAHFEGHEARKLVDTFAAQRSRAVQQAGALDEGDATPSWKAIMRLCNGVIHSSADISR